MIIIFAIDALEYDLVEEFGCKNLMQKNYGKTNISEFSQPRTMVLWSSFLTGKNKEKEVLKLGNKEMWNFSLKKEKTFLKFFKKEKVIDLPGYNYDKRQHEKERSLMKKFFESEKEKKKIREEYNKLCFQHHKKIKKEFLESLKKDYDIIIGYFSIADTIGHLNFGNKVMIKIIYKELDELAGNLGKNNKILILSDHGMKTVGEFGVHSDHGFWSINFNYKLKNPKITDFFNIIKVV